MARFAQEYLKDKYEAVYAVHNDKKHMHGHIVFNSVSFETGMKHECRKGEWKHRMQPITNRLCKEYGLSIVPAEYVKEPKNLSRKEWEREQCFRKMILADAEFCQSQAGSFEHFVFLMKRIGYQFEYGKYLSVKVPGGKWYHELDKLDERFSKEKFRFYLDMPFSRPRFVVGNTVAIHKRGITDFQMKYYRRIYQARMVEQRRFDKHSAYLAKKLERMNQLQKQYLFLVDNNIKTVEGLVTYQVLGERDVEKITERQQELYQQNRARKRACKTEEDIRDYQIWHMGVQAELDELKAEKKALNKNLRIAEGCVEEYKKFSMLDFSTIEDEIRNSIEVPEYPYAEEKNIALSVNDAVSDMEDISVMNESEDYDISLGAEVCEQISAEDKNVVFGYELSKTKYFANGMTVKLTIKSRRKILATGINLAIDSETGAIKPKDWEEKMGLSMPFEIVSADIVVTKVDKLKTNLKMAVDSSNESSGISDISCELLKTKNGAGYGIHVRSDAEHLIEMELDITLQLNRKDIKPLFNVEKNEGDK